MSIATVASRYAKSLIELAKEKNVVDVVYNDMVLFRNTVHENRGLMLALSSPVVRHEKKLGILKSLFENKVSPVSFTIFSIITRKNREAILDAIAEEFIRIYNDYKGIQKATVTVPTPLTDELRAMFIKLVGDATGKQIELEEKIDTRLIGGYVLRVNDRQIDASLKNRLSSLKLQLLN